MTDNETVEVAVTDIIPCIDGIICQCRGQVLRLKSEEILGSDSVTVVEPMAGRRFSPPVQEIGIGGRAVLTLARETARAKGLIG